MLIPDVEGNAHFRIDGYGGHSFVTIRLLSVGICACVRLCLHACAHACVFTKTFDLCAFN